MNPSRRGEAPLQAVSLADGDLAMTEMGRSPADDRFRTGQPPASGAISPLGHGPGRERSASAPTAIRRARPGPSVAELLDVDREYREGAAAGALPRVAPRRFNPTGEAWLPILHTERGRRHYTALFSNTERAHHLGRTHDWVIIACDGGADARQYTVITAERGRLTGRRIVRGHERQCAAHYARSRGARDRRRCRPSASTP